MGVASRIFCSLEGHWKFSRAISNHDSIEGVACFRKTSHRPDILFYREKETFSFLKDIQIGLSQEYEYRYAGDKIAVYFCREHDRLLHSLEFMELDKASAEHLCGSDTYLATYQFHFPDRFELLYSIKGPHKDFQVKTVFLRDHYPADLWPLKKTLKEERCPSHLSTSPSSVQAPPASLPQKLQKTTD